jgi:glycosyltransferase involved in cell wall biosynthesis
MRLVFAIATLCRGGAQRMLAELASRMTDRGHDVVVAMPRGAKVDFPLRARLAWSQDTELRSADLPAGDVLLSNFFTLVPVVEEASRAGKGLHVRLALCYEPVFLPEQERSFRTYEVTPRLLVLSRWQQELMRLLHGVEAQVVPIGISDDFRPLAGRGRNGRLRIGAVVRRPEGGYSWHRDQGQLLAACDEVRLRHPETAVWLICPPGELRTSRSLRALRGSWLDRLRGRARFRFLTPRSDRELARIYSRLDVFVSSSTYDAGSLPGLEAMRCGAALVSVYAGGNADYCRPGENCLLSYRHEGRLAADLVRLAEDPELRRRLAAAGARDAAAWTWERSADAFEQAVAGFLDRSREPARGPG